MSEKRIVRDSMGELEVDSDALFGAQTQRAVDNFPISGIKMPETFVRALLLAKSVAATANKKLDQISEKKAECHMSNNKAVVEY